MKRSRLWKDEVTAAVEKQHQKRLKISCTETTTSGEKVRTKTRFVHECLARPSYVRKPEPELMMQNKQRTRTIILARSGMLECGQNFKGTMPEQCTTCNVKDDENHRMNECKRWIETNNCSSTHKIDFEDVYCTDTEVLNRVVNEIERVWDMKYTGGRMAGL